MSAFDLTMSDEELARLVVSEYPENAELSGSPLEKSLVLGRDGVKRDPARYADIFQLALGMTNNPERKASFALEQVNGLRRRDGLWEPDPVVFAMNGALDMATNLPSDYPRRKRLRGLANYNGGILFRNLGKFERAADYQMAAAALELAAGNPDKSAISLFCAQVERTSAAFMNGDSERIQSALSTLYNLGGDLEGTMLADWFDNVVIHIMEFYFLARQMPPDMEWLIGHLDPKKTNFWPEIIHGVMVPCLRGEWDTVLANADNLLNRWVAEASSSTQKAIYACVLAKARALCGTGHAEAAESLAGLMRTEFRKHHGGYDYLAVANREFGLSPD